MTLIRSVTHGDRKALAKLLRAIDEGSATREELRELFLGGGRASIIGITGPGGVGKSTLLAALIRLFRERDRRVGVLAIDPTSPRSGGALLGDRIRMRTHDTDEGVFIRSLATRGQRGGLSPSVRSSCDALDAAGYDPIFVETAGSGQGDVEIMSRAHTTVLILGVDGGDHIQTMKAGQVEVADIVVVNKGDRPGARQALETLKGHIEREVEGWRRPVLSTIATTGEGLDELAEALRAHREHLETSRRAKAAAVDRWREEILRGLERRVREEFLSSQFGELQASAERLEQRTSDPMTEVDVLMYHLLNGTG